MDAGVAGASRLRFLINGTGRRENMLECLRQIYQRVALTVVRLTVTRRELRNNPFHGSSLS
jgi:hypothetical protein